MLQLVCGMQNFIFPKTLSFAFCRTSHTSIWYLSFKSTLDLIREFAEIGCTPFRAAFKLIEWIDYYVWCLIYVSIYIVTPFQSKWLGSIVCQNHSSNPKCKHLFHQILAFPNVTKHIDTKMLFIKTKSTFISVNTFLVFRILRTTHISLSFAIEMDCWLSSLMIWRLRDTDNDLRSDCEWEFAYHLLVLYARSRNCVKVVADL